MSHANRHLDLIDCSQQVFFEDIVSGVVAAATVTQQQDRLGLRIGRLSIALPPQAKTVTGEFACVVTETQVNVAEVPFEVKQAMRNDQPAGGTGKVMVEGRYDASGVQFPFPAEVAQMLFFLGVHAD